MGKVRISSYSCEVADKVSVDLLVSEPDPRMWSDGLVPRLLTYLITSYGGNIFAMVFSPATYTLERCNT